MKRRVISFITVLAMCLSLCPTWALAADREPDASLCPHHRVHTEACGYVPPVPGRDCTHEHDESCFIAETLCVHQHTEDCYLELEPSLCTHECSEDSGCVILTLDCPHIHDEFCGYAPESIGAPCMFVCRLCPIEDLIGKLPRSVTPDNKNQVEEQLNAILALYIELTGDEQDQLDLSRCFDLQAQLDAANTPMLLADGTSDFKPNSFDELTENKEYKTVYKVANMSLQFDTQAYSYTATVTSAFRVESTGALSLMGSGTITSQKSSGVEVQTGGKLYIEDSRLTIIGSPYALDIASGATVQLSGGTFIGDPAIRTADGDFSKLLKKGYDYFDASGNRITAAGMATAKTVTVQAQPVVAWANKTREVVYDGSPVELNDLPGVTITDPEGKPESLRQYLAYYYKKAGDPDQAYTSTPPTDAGSYEVKVVFPAMGSYRAAEDTLTLTIAKKQMTITAPTAVQLTYNGSSQKLVTAGAIGDAGAVSEGAVIEYATTSGGPYSTIIPTGVNAYEDYQVWYKVEDTKNYAGASETAITGVDIQPKGITPKIDVSDPYYEYNRLPKKPTITVRDGDTVISDSQYTITWTKGNQAVTQLKDAGTYTATIENVTSGNNYTFTATAVVEIIPMEQSQLKIEGAPAAINYGDTVDTLDTSGGAANGTVEWTVKPESLATINEETGVLTATGVGTVTVTAVRKATNYEDVEATCKIKINPKPVTAVVTVASKEYDGSTAVASNQITVTVNGVLDDDNLSVDNLTGNYSDANVGTNKPVTLNSSSATVTGATAKYTISYPSTATSSITQKPVKSPTVTLSGDDLQEDASATPKYYYNYDGKEKRPSVTVTDDGGKEIPASNYTVSYSNNTNAGTAAVTVTANAGGNYTFNPVTVNFKIEKKDLAVLTSTPQAKDLTYTGQPHDLVTVGTADGGTVWYSSTGASDSYGPAIPKETDAGTYIVYYMVKGDNNHNDTVPASVSVEIKPKEVISPVITLESYDATYDGNAKNPSVTEVKDGSTTIPTSEYTTSYSNNINAGTATVTINNKNGGNYIVNGTKTFEIRKANPTVNAPTGKENLKYNATAQELITRGSSPHGSMVYSLDGENFSTEVPLGTARGNYPVSYKVQGDSNHNDSPVATVTVSISQNTVNTPRITLSSNTFRYDGSQHTPTITVRDDNGFLIDASEYKVTYSGVKSGETDSPVSVDTYTLKVIAAGNSNYSFSTNNTGEFKIVKADQEVLSITNTRGQVYYGDVIQLGTSGGTASGTVTWKVTDASGDKDGWITDGGLLTVKDVGGSITVTATRSAGDNYGETSATWVFSANKKPVTAVLTGKDRDYAAGNVSATVEAQVDPRDLAFEGDKIDIPNLTGTFDNENVGTNKRVTIPASNPAVTGNNSEKYDITYPKTATASIRPVEAKVTTSPNAANPTYDASKAWPLLASNGDATGGTMVYSLDGSTYSRTIPTAQNAGTYTVYYKVQADSNHTDSEAETVTAEIKRKEVTPTIELSPSSATYNGNVQQPKVIARDGDTGPVIPTSEYVPVYDTGTNWIDVVATGHKVTVKNASDGNYVINETFKMFQITEAKQGSLSITDKPGQVYFGDAPFSLSVSGGSGDGEVTWSSDKPNIASIDDNGLVTIKAAGEVTITATKAASTNYSESEATYKFTEQQKPLTVTVAVAPGSYVYNNTAKEPAVTVEANDGTTLVLNTDYTVEYGNNTNAGTATVTVKSTAGSNYTFTKTAEFTIEKAKAVVTPVPGVKSELVYNGNPLQLVTEGAANWGDVEYSVNNSGFSTDIPKATNAGEYAVSYRVLGTDNYVGIDPVGIGTVTIAEANPTCEPPKPIDNLIYSGEEMGLITPGNSSDGTVEYSLDRESGYSATTPKGTEAGTYTIYYRVIGDSNHKNSEVETISVTIAQATPTSSLVYTVTIDSAKKLSDIDLTGVLVSGVTGSFVWKYGDNTLNGETVAEHEKQYDVTFTPSDTDSVNYNEVTVKVTVIITPPSEDTETETPAPTLPSTPAMSAPSTQSTPSASPASSAPMQTSIRNNAATTTLSTAAGDNLVKEAVTTQSKNVVIKPEITGSVTKTEVSLPASTVGQIGRETNAALTVSTPVAGVTIPNAALDTLSSAGGDVSVMTEQVDNTVTLTLTAGGEEVETVPGGLTLTVPAEDAGPGTVAVLVNEDGTRETIRKSVAENGELSIPLNGSATVEIVDNSKEFADVPAETWVADTVAFASAHELFNGTSETTFSPEQPMSRAMLATVLYNLEGRPAQSLTDEFSDVSSDAWYAEGVSWAAASGITNGYGDGQFGPDDNVTREQFVVMLWKYAGSPAASGQALSFTDADQVSDYAEEALRWATENGILNGYDNGQLDPGGLTTRAQAAQMLKNFMENI